MEIKHPFNEAKDNSGPGPELMGANTLTGNDVYNHANENLGDIKEIMIDVVTGKIAYAVLSYGGVLGVGEKLFAIPWNSLILDTENERFILNADKSIFDNSEGFDTDNWPLTADSSFINRL